MSSPTQNAESMVRMCEAIARAAICVAHFDFVGGAVWQAVGSAHMGTPSPLADAVERYRAMGHRRPESTVAAIARVSATRKVIAQGRAVAA